MKHQYTIHPNLIIRTPRLPFTTQITQTKIDSLIYDDAFMESIYLASPVLHKECLKYKNGSAFSPKEIRKIKNSLTKYYLRSIARCTPFGLFSGCSVGKWQQTDSLIINNKRKRHTRFDMHYLCALAQHLAEKEYIKEHLIYYTNNSTYNIGDETRYIEYKYFAGRRIHQISSVNPTEYLDQILEEGISGVTTNRIREILYEPGIDEKELNLFIAELLDSQILTSELEPSITGDEFQFQILSILKRINCLSKNEELSTVIKIMEITNRKLFHIDSCDVNPSVAYKEIMLLLDELGVVYDESKLFQTDLINQQNQGGISIAHQSKLYEALTVLNRFSSYSEENPNLLSFAKRFNERYEDQLIPLLEALDTETGLGYLERAGEDIAPLVEDIYFLPKSNPIQNYKWSPVEELLERKINIAAASGNSTIQIRDDELEPLPIEKWNDLPPSIHMLFRVVGSETKEQLFIEGCGSSSGINLLGRFAHADKGIRKVADDIVRAEEANNPDVIFAEVIHLPESRIGNVLLHPAFRSFEIPYLAKSSLQMENQIRVQDILVGVKRDHIYLVHKSTGKIIIPRLSNAHNYQYNALPVYQFLCDLQIHKLRGNLGFNWGSLRRIHKFLPRVEYRDIILSPATWQFTKEDLQSVLKFKDTPRALAEVKNIQNSFNIPNEIVLAEGDNELYINLNNESLLNLFVDSIKNKETIHIKEFLGVGSSIKNYYNERYNNQIIACLIKEAPTYKVRSERIDTVKNPDTSNSYIPGSEWLYLKLYCGAKSADRILTEAVNPIVEALSEQNMLEKFFFIRYNDPDFHIRLRLKLNSRRDLDEAMHLVYKNLLSFTLTSHIWKMQIDTYCQEISRYGASTIGIAEDIFHFDSISVIKMLEETWGDEREHLRWLWAMRSIDELLNAFEFNLEEKLSLVNSMKVSFSNEFNADRLLKEQLNTKFRHYRKEIEHIMTPEFDPNHPQYRLIEILLDKSRAINPIYKKLMDLQAIAQLPVPLNDLLYSYIHMLVNRIITSKPRLHELVIYDFLYRYYRSQAGRQGMQLKNLKQVMH